MLAPTAAQTPVAATAAVATLAAHANSGWRLKWVYWGYSATPTGGSLTIAWTDPVAGAVSMVIGISAGGPGSFQFDTPFPANTSVVITLASGAGSVVGSVYVDAVLG